MVNFITNTLKPLATAISENVLEIRVSYLAGPLFVRIFTDLTHLYGLPYEVWWLVLANFGNVLKTRVAICRTQPPWFLNY